MIATNLFVFAVFLIAVGCGQAQNDPLLHEWKATLSIVDDNNQPVPGAEATIIYSVVPPPGQVVAGAQAKGLTDSNGVFTASHRDGSLNLVFRVQKEGYYSTTMTYEIGLLGQPINPAKLKPVLTLVLKKIGHPIPMYAKREETKIQKENEPVGYDLMAGDWVAPHGKGKIADMLFTVHRKIESERKYNADLKVTFPSTGDGIAIAPAEPDTGSVFKTPRTAAESGYESDRTWRYSSTAGPDFVSGYFLRVRTVLDEKGNVKSALYGKIHGDFRFYAGTKAPRAGMGFDYYLNPTPNDRNVEFDPKQNLLKGLDFLSGGNLTP